MNWDGPITRVLAREGGWSDRADDRGGPTNRGITLRTFARWRTGHEPTPAEVLALKDELRALSENEARMIYLQLYVKDVRLDDLTSDRLKEAMFDWGVNSGPARPVTALQRTLGVTADGVLGPQTAAVANAKDGDRLAVLNVFDRVEFIADWMRNDKRDADHDGTPDSIENAAGILKRICSLGRSIA